MPIIRPLAGQLARLQLGNPNDVAGLNGSRTIARNPANALVIYPYNLPHRCAG
jgi:hypothetical protein